MAIKTVNYFDKSAVEIENEFFKVVVLPSEGSNVFSLFDKTKNVELLRTTMDVEAYNKRKMLFGTPVLVPPNRIEDATFTFNSLKYELEMNRAKENNHIHGFVKDKEWTIKEMNNDLNELITSLDSDDFPSIKKQFPHSFELEMKIKLTNEGTVQTLKVLNKSGSLMPFGLGYHTTFFFDNEHSILKMDVQKEWILNNRNLPTGELKETEYQKLLKKGTNLYGISLDHVFPFTSNKEAVINHPNLGIELSYVAEEGFKHWVLYTGDGKSNFMAIEPYSWVTNAPNIDLPDELTGFIAIAPNETKEFVTSITVRHK